MIIQQLLEKLENSSTPLAQALHKSDHSKALAMVFKKGMRLKEHKAILPSTLVVIKGEVVYKDSSSKITVRLYENCIIPVNVIHEVEATEDSICILMQG